MAGIDFTSSTSPIGFSNFIGGLNSTTSALSLKDSEASDLQNIDFDNFGAFKKRNGYSQLNTSAFNSGATWTSLHSYQISDGNDFLIGTCGDKLAKMDSLDGTWDDITGGLTITAGDSNKFEWRTFNDIAYGTNNVDPPIKWDGTGNGATMGVVSGLTDAKWIESWQNYFFMADTTISGTRHATRIYWSAIDDAETWDAADFNEIGFQDGQDITGLHDLGDRLVIFKEHSIWYALFTGDADIPFIFRQTPSHVGCQSGYSIQEVSNGLMFLSQDGYYLFDGINSVKISDRITNTLDSFNKNLFDESISVFQHEKNKYWGAFPNSGSSQNDRVITYDSFNNAFSLYEGHNPNAFARVVTSGEERIYFGDYSGYVYRADDGTDDLPSGTTTAINAFFKTKWFQFNDIIDKKGVPNATIFYQYNDGTLSLGYNFDLRDGDQKTLTIDTTAPGENWDTAVWDEAQWGVEGGSIKRKDLTGRGYVIRFNFSNNKEGETFEVNGLGINPHLETNS